MGIFLIVLFLTHIIFSLNLYSRIFYIVFFVILVLRFRMSIIWYHVIIILIILEIFILIIFFLVNFYVILLNCSRFFIFIFITLRVAEARVGLSLLTILVRRHGNDYIKITFF